MRDRVNLTDRRGVNAFEGFVLNSLNWIFREQSIVDLGIDAYIEQVIKGNSTGKLIAVQIKTGLSNVYANKNGDFDYYISNTHYNYWLSYTIPVIIVLYDHDPDKKVLYWEAFFKRNLTKTKDGRSKITIKKSSICCTLKTISDYNDIITLYKAKLFAEDVSSPMDKDELGDYCSELFFRCSESLQKIRGHIDQLDIDYNRGTEEMQNFMASNRFGWTREQADKEIKKVGRAFSLALNSCRTRITNELPLMVEVFIETFQSIELYLLPEINISEYKDINTLISKELYLLKNSMDSLKNITSKVISHYNNSPKTTLELGKAQTLFGKVIEDYHNELINLSIILGFTIKKLSNK